jgi:hypothetical protein
VAGNKFYVVDIQGPAVVGLPSSEKLKLVTLHCAINKHKQTAPTPEEAKLTETPKIKSTADLIRLYPDQFDKIGSLTGVAKIHLKADAKPYIDPPRKRSIHLRDKLKIELDKMTKQGAITKIEEHTDWCSSLAISKKADGSLRICLGPAQLNQAVKRCPHNIPTLDELNYKFRDARYFSKLDANAGYLSVHLDKDSQLITTFRTPIGRYCFTRLSFGLATNQDIFQACMDSILEQCEGAVDITDDIAGHGATEEEHNQRLHQLMQVAEKNGLVLNSDKCTIMQSEISFFGMIHGINGIKPDPNKVEDLQAMPSPTSKKELQEFLGLIQYLSPFIDNLSERAAPLRDLLKKDVPFEWDSDHQHQYDKIKTLISSDACIQYYDVNGPVELMVDASQRGLGAALLQPDKHQQFKPVAYSSKSQSPTQSRYANIERELLAVCFEIDRFKTYLYGRHFKVITDHKSLVMIVSKNLTAAPPRLQRMLLLLQGYSFTIEYRPGKDVGLVDSLSRLPNPSKCEEIDLDLRVDLVNFQTQKLVDIREQTTTDPVLQCLVDTIRQGWPETIQELPRDIREYWAYRDELLVSIKDGIILKGERVLIPTPLRKDILQ